MDAISIKGNYMQRVQHIGEACFYDHRTAYIVISLIVLDSLIFHFNDSVHNLFYKVPVMRNCYYGTCIF